MRVLITRKLPQAGINILHQYRELELDFRSDFPLSEKGLIRAVKGVDAIIPVFSDKITKKVINSAGKNLKIIATYSIGYNHIDLETATKKGVYVANTPGDTSETVGEYTMSLILSLARRIPEADRFCRSKQYKYWDPMRLIGAKLMGKTLGIIGFGATGQYVAKMAKYGFNMNILYNDLIAHTEAGHLLDAKKVSLDSLLENSDIVSLHCPLNQTTKHLIGESQFKKMKPLAYLINTSRGQIINEQALLTALKEGGIAGAALDVFENEPKISSELLKMENVIITPHIGSATWEARIQMARMAAENVVDVLINKKEPRYLVNKELLEGRVSTIF